MTEVRRSTSDQEMRANFRWQIPSSYNIGWDICGKWAESEPERPALVEIRADGARTEYTFGGLDRAAGRLANVLRYQAGIQRGDRCAILLPQSSETVIAHVAMYRIGAIALPLFTLFGEDAIRERMTDAGVRVVITDSANLEKVLAVQEQLPNPPQIYVIGDDNNTRVSETCRLLATEMAKASPECDYVETVADDPAFLSYTSGTTGPPKGALHAHRVLLGHVPGVQLPHEWFPQDGDRMWTPADWAWMGGLTNIMMPALKFGIPLIAYRASKFDPEQAIAMVRREGVRNMFLPPTALKMIRQAYPVGELGLSNVRSVASGGEVLGAETLEWGKEAFGLTINEFYGQTECNLVVGNCASLFPPVPSSAGRPIPGHEVAIIDELGNAVANGVVGELAIRAPDPVMFLRYWNRPQATRDKFAGEWMRTGDLGSMDEMGYVRFLARSDDVITSAGYRIGPSEIEDCLTGHPAVALAGVVGIPDEVRTEVVTAFVVPTTAVTDDAGLTERLQQHVRERLGGHLVPRRVVFVDEVPLTSTGKIMRRKLRELISD